MERDVGEEDKNCCVRSLLLSAFRELGFCVREMERVSGLGVSSARAAAVNVVALNRYDVNIKKKEEAAGFLLNRDLGRVRVNWEIWEGAGNCY